MPEWVFAELTGAAVRRDPNETELFKTADTGDDEYAGTDALVREVIQNSMDAGTRNGPVRVRFSLHSVNDLPPPDRLATYFRRLEPALESRQIDFDGQGTPRLDSGFLVCEDFGTGGLGGNVMQNTDPPVGHGAREDFFWFWRNIGRSGKTDDDLGRWGLGKTVYRAASRVGCMLGLTVRKDDHRRLLMGQAVLKLHRHHGAEYAPEGFWCDGCDEHDVPVPIETDSELDRFVSEWKLTRRDEPGLSVVVPYVPAVLRAEAILKLVAINFFVPVIRGELIVDVVGPGLPSGEPEIRVDAASIEEVCRSLTWNGKVTQKQSSPPPIDLASEANRLHDEIVPTNLLGQQRLPVIDEEAFDPETLRSLRERFADGGVVPIRVRILLPRKSDVPLEGMLEVFMRRPGGSDRYESYYVREGMTITRLNSKRRLRGVQGLVLVPPGPLGSLLGDTEGPAHISWDTSNDERANRVWTKWKGRVQFCSGIIDGLAELLQPPPDEADFDLLSDVFSIDKTTPNRPDRKPSNSGKSNGAFEPPPPTPRWYRSMGKPGGFRIKRSKELPIPDGATLLVSVAYDMAGGNPLRNWTKFDFDFRRKENRSIRFTGDEVQATLKGGNMIELVPNGESFDFSAEGFDIHRDLFLRIDEVTSEEETER